MWPGARSAEPLGTCSAETHLARLDRHATSRLHHRHRPGPAAATSSGCRPAGTAAPSVVSRWNKRGHRDGVVILLIPRVSTAGRIPASGTGQLGQALEPSAWHGPYPRSSVGRSIRSRDSQLSGRTPHHSERAVPLGRPISGIGTTSPRTRLSGTPGGKRAGPSRWRSRPVAGWGWVSRRRSPGSTRGRRSRSGRRRLWP